MKELCVDNIRKSFGAVRALDGVSFCCRSGEILGLIGANGSGKTTLSRIIAGIITPDSGKIIADGQELCFRHPREARSRGIVMAHQNLSLIENLSIWENIALDHEFLTPKGFLDDKRSRAFVEEWLHKVGIEIDLDTKVESLSPDLRQVLEIVKAMSWDPSLLLLDEPTASLDYEKVRLVFELIRKEKEKGKLIVFVSHRINEIVELCDRIVVLRNGRKVVELDTSSDACDQRTIVEFMVGEGIGLEKEKRCFVFGESDQSRDKSKIVLEVKHLSVAKRVDDVSLFLRQGEFLGIGGLQGQGQEELLLALFGAIPVSSGEIKFSGRSVNFAHPIDAIKAGVVLIPGDRQREGLFLEQTILFNFIYPSLNVAQKRWINYTDFRQKFEHIAKQIRLVYAHFNQEVRHLSGGNQQKVVIGKWLALKPQIMLLNDPTKGVDVGARRELYELIHKMREEGVSVILFASDNRELIENCDRVLVMYGGRIVDEIGADDLCESRLIASSLCVEW